MRGLLPIVMMALATLLVCCDNRPDGVLSEKKMASLLADLELADGVVSRDLSFSGDSLKKTVYQSVLQEHGVTQAQFDSTLRYYGYNIDEYEEVLKKSYIILQKKEREFKGASGNAELAEISSGLWPYRNFMLVSPLAKSQNIQFSVTDKEIGKGEILVWKYRMLESGKETKIMLGVDYDDGSVEYTSNPSQSSGGFTEIRLQTDTAKTVKRIFGRVGFPNNRSYLLIDSISLSTLPFDKDAFRYSGGQRLFKRPDHKKAIKGEVSDSLDNQTTKDSIRSNDTIVSRKKNLPGRPGNP